MQERIEGEEEVTVVYVDGKMYAANAPRNSFNSDDSRVSLFTNPISWPKCEISHKDECAIRGFMDETGYRFGRFDFIKKDGELWFLELNPNGQWAWLDQKNEHGLVTMVANAIKKEDSSHQICLWQKNWILELDTGNIGNIGNIMKGSEEFRGV